MRTATKLQFLIKKIWEVKLDIFRDNFLNLDIYYKYLTVEEIYQQPAFEFLSLLSEVCTLQGNGKWQDIVVPEHSFFFYATFSQRFHYMLF